EKEQAFLSVGERLAAIPCGPDKIFTLITVRRFEQHLAAVDIVNEGAKALFRKCDDLKIPEMCLRRGNESRLKIQDGRFVVQPLLGRLETSDGHRYLYAFQNVCINRLRRCRPKCLCF